MERERGYEKERKTDKKRKRDERERKRRNERRRIERAGKVWGAWRKGKKKGNEVEGREEGVKVGKGKGEGE